MRYRQIHLDFHTSSQIRDIGTQFSKEQFQEMLLIGNIDSITLFSKCHHGMNYHPTGIGMMHPYLKFNLLKEQIDACHEINVKTPVYISAGLDEYYYQNHPGDCVIPPKGNDPLRVGFTRLCFNTDYLEYLCKQIAEVTNIIECDGIFLDIVNIAPCVCKKCLQDMFDLGRDPSNNVDVLDFAKKVQIKYLERTYEAVRKNSSTMPIFQNVGHIYKGDRNFLKYVTHLELESLPTGGWGYDHFPGSAKYTACLGMDFLGMTGKFHTSWGEFGGFKHKNALQYETSAMLAFGAKCSIGDQLHPSGKMNNDTYRLIGLAYSEVKKKESFCDKAEPVSEVALLSSEALRYKNGKDLTNGSGLLVKLDLPDIGAIRMLLEKQVMFDVIDAETSFEKYKTIIIPDERNLCAETCGNLHEYINNGGKLVLSYQSGLMPDKDEFYFDIGSYEGLSGFDPEYLQVSEDIFKGDLTGNLIRSPFVIFGGSVNMRSDGQVYSAKINPYFNRTLAHFSSHQHAPENQKSEYPAIVIKNNICYFANKIFTAYANHGQLLYRDLFYTVLEKLHGGFNAYTSLQSSGRISLTEQKEKQRYVLHLLYASPVKRGGDVLPDWGLKDVEVIEDIVRLSDIKCRIKLKKQIRKVRIPLENLELPFEQAGEYIKFTVPEINCHQIVTLEYDYFH